MMYDSGRDVWAKELRARRPDVSMETIEKYLHNLYRVRPDFVYSVSRDFVRSCQTPMLVLPDDTPRARLPDIRRRRVAGAECRGDGLSLEGTARSSSARTINRVRTVPEAAYQPSTAARAEPHTTNKPRRSGACNLQRSVVGDYRSVGCGSAGW